MCACVVLCVGVYRHRRTWKPNVQEKRIESAALGKMLNMKVSMHALRLFDKMGGLDQYLLHTPYAKLDEGLTRTLRAMVESAVRRKAEVEAWDAAPEAKALYRSQINTAPQPPPLVHPIIPHAVRQAGFTIPKSDPEKYAVVNTTPTEQLPSDQAAAMANGSHPLFRYYDRTAPRKPPAVIPSPRKSRATNLALQSLLASPSATPFIDLRTKYGGAKEGGERRSIKVDDA